jgi:DNA repair exonuclease SbcCD ATPase subunit
MQRANPKQNLIAGLQQQQEQQQQQRCVFLGLRLAACAAPCYTPRPGLTPATKLVPIQQLLLHHASVALPAVQHQLCCCFGYCAAQAVDSREQLLAAKRIIRSCHKVADLLRRNGSVDIDSLFSTRQPQQPQQYPSKNQQARQAQQQRAAEQERKQQQKKQEALAKLQAVQASKQPQQPAAAVLPQLSKPLLVRPGFAEAPNPKQLQQQVELWQQMQQQQQALAREQEQLLVQQQQLLQALQEEDERQQQLALAAEQQAAQDAQLALEAEQQRIAEGVRQAAEAAEAERQRQQKKQEALAKLQAMSQLQRQQQAGAAAKPLLQKPGLVRPGGVPQKQQRQQQQQ